MQPDQVSTASPSQAASTRGPVPVRDMNLTTSAPVGPQQAPVPIVVGAPGIHTIADAQPAPVVDAQPATLASAQPAPAPAVGSQPAPAPAVGSQPAPAPAVGSQPAPAPAIGAQPAPAPAIGAQPAPAPGIGVQPAPAACLQDPTPLVAIAGQAIQALAAIANGATQALLQVASHRPPAVPASYSGHATPQDRGLSAFSLLDRMSERTVSEFVALHRMLRTVRDRDDVDEEGPTRLFQITTRTFKNTKAEEITKGNGNSSNSDGSDDGRETSPSYAPSITNSSSSNSSGSSAYRGYYADANFLNGDLFDPADDSPGPTTDSPAHTSPEAAPAPACAAFVPARPRYNFPQVPHPPFATFFAERRTRSADPVAAQNAINRANPIYILSDCEDSALSTTAVSAAGSGSGSTTTSTSASASAASVSGSGLLAAPMAGPSRKHTKRRESCGDAPAKRVRRDKDTGSD